MTRWADVLGWPGYRVSDNGVVAGPRRDSIVGYRDKNGYHCVRFYRGAESVAAKVHRLVVAAFIGPIPEGMQVNHINGIKDDNRVENLEIVTPSQNTKHGYGALGRKGRNFNPAKGVKHPNAKLNAADVRAIRRLYAAGASQVDLAERFSTPQTNISRIVRREAWRHID